MHEQGGGDHFDGDRRALAAAGPVRRRQRRLRLVEGNGDGGRPTEVDPEQSGQHRQGETEKDRDSAAQRLGVGVNLPPAGLIDKSDTRRKATIASVPRNEMAKLMDARARMETRRFMGDSQPSSGQVVVKASKKKKDPRAGLCHRDRRAKRTSPCCLFREGQAASWRYRTSNLR